MICLTPHTVSEEFCDSELDSCEGSPTDACSKCCGDNSFGGGGHGEWCFIAGFCMLRTLTDSCMWGTLGFGSNISMILI